MLTTEKVVIRFGGLIAVNEVSIDVKPGIITGLIGPNGAGKTTLFNCISGVYKPNSGSVLLGTEHIEGKQPYQINKLGISRTYQIINLFRKMSVIDNVMVGMHSSLKSGYFSNIFRVPAQRREESESRAKAYEWLKFVNLENKMNDPAGSLSYGNQRLLEIVRGLASTPKIILLDEPAAGMNETEKAELKELLQKILSLGVTILMIEHDMKLMMGCGDYIYVLNNGYLLAQGLPENIVKNPEVIKAYLGERK